ncbi:histidine phosphatase family protein [Actinoplanes sp. ATCC 53533]|uniref:histidine phosphatase family protein n=1 Tax=Actinoplanes sp. ATCC 53533 TaxID=1288362 RepID=UPI000F7A4B2F|nr:histidine phosphatase family protein [Actinoplanes sp. ATCC 53533]RSM57736.1 histidine phosphatase family protein [Actinoplanes sp. ATCC 53533]
MVTILLVRHADIDLPRVTRDPSLNDAGRQRAQALAHVVASAVVTTAFTSSFRRTKETVGPALEVLGIGAREMPAPVTVAREARAGTLGAVVLIAGHSDTVPEVIAALGVPSPPVIGETQFDNLFVVTLAEPTGASLLALKYANPSA